MGKERIEQAARALLPAIVRDDGGAVTGDGVTKGLRGAMLLLLRLDALVDAVAKEMGEEPPTVADFLRVLDTPFREARHDASG